MKWSTAWAASRGVRRCKIHTCATHKTHIHPPQILTTNRTHSLLYQRHSSSFYFYYLLQLFCVNHRSIKCLMLVKCNDMYYFCIDLYQIYFTVHFACKGLIHMLGSVMQQTLHADTWTNMLSGLYACVCIHTHIYNRGEEKACAPPCPKPVLNRSPKVLRRPICLGSDQNLRGTDIPAQ